MPTIMPRTPSYRVRKGDTLWNIAQMQYGNPNLWQEISKANHLSDPKRLLAGLTLKLPMIQPSIAGRPGVPSAGLRTPPPPPSSLSNAANYAAKAVLPPTFKITPTDAFRNLDVGAKGSKCRMKLNFELFASRKGVLEALEASPSGLSITPFQTEAKQKFSKLLSESKLKFDSSKKGYELTLGSGTAITDARGNVLLATTIEAVPGMTVKFVCKEREVKIPSRDYEFKGKFGFEVECKNDEESRGHRSAIPVVNAPEAWNTPRPLIVAGEFLLGGSIVILVAVTLPADAVVAGAMTFLEAAALIGRVAPGVP